MSHGHSHCEHHGHAHTSGDPNDAGSLKRFKKMRFALILTSIYFVAELVGGVLSGSLALLADAGHMLADSAAIALALFAAWISTKEAGTQKTYGYHRVETLAAFVNALALAGISFLIMYEAYHRLQEPAEVAGPMMMGVAFVGLLINLWVVSILHGDHEHDLNMKGAYLHVLGDLLGSVGALIAAGMIMLWGWQWADPVISIVISLLVLVSAFRLLLEASDILLENCPAHLKVDAVRQAMLDEAGVLAIHDLHVWTIASGKYALSAHVTVEVTLDYPKVLMQLQHCLKENFGLSHVTIQLEPPGFEEDEIHF